MAGLAPGGHVRRSQQRLPSPVQRPIRVLLCGLRGSSLRGPGMGLQGCPDVTLRLGWVGCSLGRSCDHDLAWVKVVQVIGSGQSEPAFEQTAFSLRKGELSDVVTTSRGVHIIQRIA
eukprot:Skav232768  [mRNA]  locus=scaffold1229:256417:256897:- [translate_table: standard]